MSSLSKSLEKIPYGYLLTPATIFMISTMVVNGGNYGYNMVLGRLLDPAQFSKVGLLVTLLLVASFIAMTFQIVATKFTVEVGPNSRDGFQLWFEKLGVKVGCVIMIILWLSSGFLSDFFRLSHQWSMVIFAATMLLFFLMSVKRGFLQGSEKFISLSSSYQGEMWGRVVLTLVLLLLVNWSIDLQISIAILGSVTVGYLVITEPKSARERKSNFFEKRKVYRFLGLTAGYEGAQILINYSDILLVKHYFDEEIAGLYTSMALIGRMIYFMTWMVVMILIPKVLRLKKEGKNHRRALLRYFSAIAGFSTFLVFGAFLFSNELVLLLFGSPYLPVAPMLWQYGLATMLFALSNVLVYYFLSLDYKFPVYLAILFGFIQVILFFLFHESLQQMIQVQIVNMSALLLYMLVYFKFKKA